MGSAGYQRCQWPSWSPDGPVQGSLGRQNQHQAQGKCARLCQVYSFNDAELEFDSKGGEAVGGLLETKLDYKSIQKLTSFADHPRSESLSPVCGRPT